MLFFVFWRGGGLGHSFELLRGSPSFFTRGSHDFVWLLHEPFMYTFRFECKKLKPPCRTLGICWGIILPTLEARIAVDVLGPLCVAAAAEAPNG